MRRYPGCTFASPADLAKHIAYTAILDLLVKDYAEQAARERDVALGLHSRDGDKSRGDRTSIWRAETGGAQRDRIYEKEIAGGVTQTNFGDIVDVALVKAKR